jgi:S1-C subfamily serine protease
MKDKLSWALVIITSMVLGAGIVVGIDAARSEDDGGRTAVVERGDATPAESSGNNGATIDTNIDDLADLYEAVRPSVVLVTAANANSTGTGSGSGVVIDKEGHILTNNHVVSGAGQLSVSFWDGTQATAQVVGTDSGDDLAVIKVDVAGDKLRPAKLGNSDAVRAGEFVLAVGNPFGIEGSVTQGIVSGLGRTLGGGSGRPLRQLIQSDAAINPGNSGGGLFNKRGEVIGITTAIENPSGDRVFVGIGYAVPINIAERFLPDMLAGRPIQHPRMGVGLDQVTPATAARYSLGVQEGVMVTAVEANSAAGRAGLRGVSGSRGGDVILSIDGVKTNTFEELAKYIDSKKVGDTIKLRISRDGQESTIDLTLEAWRSTNA